MRVGDDAIGACVRAGDSIAWLALPVFVAMASYAAVITAGFVWDDFFLIVSSPLVTGHGSWVDHFTLPFSNNPLQEAHSFYRPLVTLSYWCDQRLWNGWAGGFHLTNLALHVGFVALLFALCRRAGASRPVAAWLASLFAVAPRLSESVAWISGRTDIAAGIAGVAAVLVFRSGPGFWRRRVLAGFLLLLGLLCKEVTFAAAVALAVLAWQQPPKPRSIRRWLVDVAPVAVAMMAYFALRAAVMLRTPDNPFLSARGVVVTAILTLEAVARYAWMVVDPFQPRIQIGDSYHPNVPLAVLGAALVLGLALLLWKVRSKAAVHVWVAVALGATSIALVLPVMPLDLNVVAADRFLYLPLAALALVVVGPVERLWQARRIQFFVAAAALLLGFALVTSARARRWASEIPLWREAVAQSSTEQPLPRVELSAALMRRGRYQEALRYLDEVHASRKQAVAVNAGTCLDKLGHREAAIQTVEAAVAAHPQSVNARVTLMLLHARAHRFELASAMGKRLLADFPYRGDLPALVAQIEQAMADMQALPSENAGESTELKARRADLYDRLGALPEALSLWRALALDGAAQGELRLKGAGYVVLFGYEGMARDLLDWLSNQAFAGHRVAALRSAFQLRFDDE